MNPRSDPICPVCLRHNVPRTRIESAVPQREGSLPENRSHADCAFSIDCPICGQYAITECDSVNATSERLRTWDPTQLSALLREQTIRGMPQFWLQFGMDRYGPLVRDELTPIAVEELLKRWPQTVSERLDRALCNIALLSHAGGAEVELTAGPDAAILFAKDSKEAHYHLASLSDLGRIRWHMADYVRQFVVLLPAGWDRFDQLTRGSSSATNPVFVAMWFGVSEKSDPTDMTTVEMKRIYEKGIRPAVEAAGYRVTRVDLEEFNDCIMDKVLGDIRAAPFVVADFTGHRNGVYLEAGFARGLGHPVIQTCAESHMDKAHFDTRHLNHICWKDASDLRERLLQRIRGTIGVGPYWDGARSS